MSVRIAQSASPGLWALAWRRLRRDPVGMVSLAIVSAYLVLVVAAAAGLIAADWSREAGVNYAPPGFAGADAPSAPASTMQSPAVAWPEESAISDPLADVLSELRRGLAVAPAMEARASTLPLGGDKWGRDVLKKAVKGTQTSLIVGLVAALLAVFIGTVLGAYAGYFGGRMDDFLNWVYSVFTSIPYLLLVLAIAAVLNQKGTITVILILGLTGWTGIFRLVRAEYLKHRTREYVLAADAIGTSNLRRMFAHIFPNVSHVVLVQLSLHVVLFIKSEVILSFLGFGVGVDTVSWGSMLNESQSELILGKWWQLAAATAAMAVLVTAFSLFTDALRDALDPEIEMTAASDKEVLLSVRNLKVDFRLDDGAVLHAVKGVSFDVPANRTVALVGESGSGKSVTALGILNLLPAANARLLPGSAVIYRGRDLLRMTPREITALRGAEISMVFQEPMSSLNPVFSVGFQLVEVLQKHVGLGGKRAREQAIALLEEVGIPDPHLRIAAYPHQLSGGQQQRVMIAMAIACEPRLLIADEPTTSLDVTVQKQILMLLAELRRRHQMSMLFITHDLGLVAEVADHVVVMREGDIREQGSAGGIFSAPKDPYTRALLACRPPLDRRPQRLPVVDDFLGKSPAIVNAPERHRGLRGDEAIILEVNALSKSFYFREGLFTKREFKALKGASFKLAKGRTLGVVGESGSGKTTMALTLMRLTPSSGGTVLFDGRELLALTPAQAMPYKRHIQIVFQNPYASLNPRFTAGQILMEPMQVHAVGADEPARVHMAMELMRKVGLPESALFKYPHEFSGGQRQRIAIARCLTLKPDVLICDEAVSALDLSVQAQLLNLLQDLQDEFGMSYVFISHDLAVVKYMSDEVMVMKDGEIVEMADSDEIYRNPQHPYTQQLLAAMPGVSSVVKV